MDKSRFSVKDYRVGWISALAIEHAAATVMLDEEHLLPCDFDSHSNDDNLYTFGRIGSHNVVLSCLASGKYGTISAAWTASRMVSRFPRLRFGLLVGIGGGVPNNKSDIRLGDIAVSLPRGNLPGVVQYDFGKQYDTGFLRHGLLNSPPPIILNAITLLRAREALGQDHISDHLSIFKLLPKNPFAREKAGPDMLFEDDGNVRQRTQRHSTTPVCHYGTIASGNIVMKSSKVRDQISSDLDGVICYEMEAAGLMDHFPALVVRGICDYADSHKNKEWQPYAAAAAAAYAKSLLSVIPGTSVEKETAATGNALPLEGYDNSENISQLPGGPRRVHKSIRGQLKDSGSTSPETELPKSISTDHGKEHSQVLQRLREPPRSKASFVLFDRTMHFYGEVYIGNGNIMKNVINNQGGVIRNSGGPMNLVGNVGGSLNSTNNSKQFSRGFPTRSYQSKTSILSYFRTIRGFLRR